MKVKLEIDLTPQEAQELFIPGEKQQEFAAAMARAYTEAMTDAAQKAFDKTIDTLNPFSDK